MRTRYLMSILALIISLGTMGLTAYRHGLLDSVFPIRFGAKGTTTTRTCEFEPRPDGLVAKHCVERAVTDCPERVQE